MHLVIHTLLRLSLCGYTYLPLSLLRPSLLQARHPLLAGPIRWQCWRRPHPWPLPRLPCRLLPARQQRVIVLGMHGRPIPKHKRKLRLLQLSTRSAPAIDEAAVVLCVRSRQRHRHSGSSRSDDLHCLQQRPVLHTVDDPVRRLQRRKVRRYGGRDVCVCLYGMQQGSIRGSVWVKRCERVLGVRVRVGSEGQQWCCGVYWWRKLQPL